MRCFRTFMPTLNNSIFSNEIRKTFLIIRMKYDQQKDICSANLHLEDNLLIFHRREIIRNIENFENFLHARKNLISTKICIRI